MTQTPTTPTPTDAQQYIDVRINPTPDVYLFDYDPNKQHVGLYVKDTASLHFVTRDQHFVDWHSPCANIHITMDQWDRFIKRLAILSAPIRSIMVQLNIDRTKSSIIKQPDTSAIFIIRCHEDPIPPIEVYDAGSNHYDDVLRSTDYMVPYDPQLDEYITRFMKELTETMNEWLHLK